MFWKKKDPTDGQSEGWERRLILELAGEANRERRRTRRWGNFFKILTFLYLFILLALYSAPNLKDKSLLATKVTALVELKGVISADSEASADKVVQGLREAFEDAKTQGVILRINSPGGSPVQAGYIYDEIKRLRKKYPKIPLYAVVTDMCASGGYYVAAAADRIYVDKASVVGSIGVLMNAFGFVDGMKEIGVERRLLTSGEHKGIMDPFSPMSDFDRDHLKRVLGQIHQQFIQVVKEGRGDRLKEDELTFSGLFWTGEEAIQRGLADAFGSSSQVARDVIEAEVIKDFTVREDLLHKWSKQMGTGVTQAVVSTLNDIGLR